MTEYCMNNVANSLVRVYSLLGAYMPSAAADSCPHLRGVCDAINNAPLDGQKQLLESVTASLWDLLRPRAKGIERHGSWPSTLPTPFKDPNDVRVDVIKASPVSVGVPIRPYTLAMSLRQACEVGRHLWVQANLMTDIGQPVVYLPLQVHVTPWTDAENQPKLSLVFGVTLVRPRIDHEA